MTTNGRAVTFSWHADARPSGEAHGGNRRSRSTASRISSDLHVDPPEVDLAVTDSPLQKKLNETDRDLPRCEMRGPLCEVLDPSPDPGSLDQSVLPRRLLARPPRQLNGIGGTAAAGRNPRLSGSREAGDGREPPTLSIHKPCDYQGNRIDGHHGHDHEAAPLQDWIFNL